MEAREEAPSPTLNENLVEGSEGTRPKEPRFKNKYNVLSRLLFLWVDPLFFVGCRRDLKQSDLYAHPQQADSSKLGEKFDQYWGQELDRKNVNKKPRLWMVFAKSFKWSFLLQFLLSLVEVALFVAQSVILGELVDYFTVVSREQVTDCTLDALGMNTTASSTASTVDAYMYSLGLFLMAFGVAMVHAHYGLIGSEIGMMSRIMSTSAVYNKLLRLSQTTIARITDGHIINVVSNDVQRLDLAYIFLPFLFIAPLHMAVFAYLAYREVGWVIFITLILFILQIPVQLVMAKIFVKFRFKSAAETDKRVLVMNEVITGARVLKMYAWEHAFKRLVTALRQHEIHFVRIGGLIRTMISSYNFAVSLTLFMAITFITYVRTGGELTPRRVIVTLSLMGFLRTVGASFLIRAIFLLSEGKVALTRIQDLLELEEINSDDSGQQSSKELKKFKKVLPQKAAESPYLPGTRKIVQSDVPPVMLTSLKSVGNGTGDPDDELYPLPPPKGSEAEDDVVPLPPSLAPPADQETNVVSEQDPKQAIHLTSFGGGASQITKYVKVTDLAATWKEKAETMEEMEGQDSPGENELVEDLMDTAVLKNVSFELTQEKPFLAVVGKVAAGKSSLLQCLMSELKPLTGEIRVRGSVSYASQIPWVFYGTIRENILFGLEYDERRYQGTIDACALRVDLNDMPDGDQTLVGERGVVLSGGQKARVNLARAVYRRADIYLLDDPLSAVDAAVGKQIFSDCIQCFLKGKLVILVTHQVQFAVSADQLLILNKGEVEGFHTRAQCRMLGIDQHKLLKMLKDKGSEFVYDDINDDEEDEEDEVDGEDDDELVLEATDINFTTTTSSIGGFPTANTARFSRFSSNPIDKTASLPPKMSMMTSLPAARGSPSFKRLATISEKNSYQFILSSRDDITSANSSVTRQRLTSFSRRENYGLDSVVEPQDYTDNVSIKSAEAEPTKEDGTATKGGQDEEKAHGTVSLKTYLKFFLAGTNVVVLLFAVFIFLLGEAGIVLADTWLSKWSSCLPPNTTVIDSCVASEPICRLTDDERLGAYGGITIASIIINFVRSAIFYLICLNASRVLHNRMFAAVIRVPMRFFDTNPSGRIINRFSKDIGFLDDLLPHTFLEYVFLLLKFFAILVTAAYSNPYILIPAVLIVVSFVVFRWYYLKTSRDIKRLEAIARSPVYSHVSTTLHGLATIRTLNMEDKVKKSLHLYQNQHTQGWHLYLVTQRWFGMRIDVITALYLGVVAVISVPLARSLDSGVIGLALAYTISLAGILQFCVRQSAEVENIMISTERILEYGRLQPEAPLDTEPSKKPSDEWPKAGKINFNEVKFKYAKGLPYAVNNLTVAIKPGEKIGIMGRTGAGKSSLISILFRLAEPEGEIIIDGIDIKNLGLHDLRKNMSIIPQDPVLFGGTVRYNLDPLERHDDGRLWEVLEQVQLKEAVQAMQGQLSGEVAEGGSNFSVGQKQLVCLARALLNDNKILILDEATANVDIGTDAIIQSTIKEKFSRCTVLTIAHRLNTIMDSDKILVMSHGQKAEFDTPFHLLQDRDSLFSKMVDKTGPEASRVLRSLVKYPSSS